MNKPSPDQLLSIGCSISVWLQHPEGGFVATVTSISPENIHVVIVNQPSSLPLTKGDVVLVTYLAEEELDYFRSTILDVSGPTIVLSTTDSKMDVQRRRSYRLRFVLPLSYTVIIAAKSDLVGQTVEESSTANITAGGLQFETDLSLEEGDTLAVTLDLSPLPTMKVHGWVVWTKEKQRDEKPQLDVGLAFLQIEPAEQVQLLQFLIGSHTKDRRIFPRWVSSVPCTVRWIEHEVEGSLINLSFGGALVSQISDLPPENTEVEIEFQAKEKITVNARVSSSFVLRLWENEELEEVGFLGVTFEESPETIRPKLTPILRELFSQHSGAH